MSLLNVKRILTKINPPFDYLSDLHLEIRKEQDVACVIKPASDTLILAGDIGNIRFPKLKEFLDWCDENYNTTIYVLGNHEYYDKKSTKNKTFKEYKDLCDDYQNIHLLENETYENEKYKFVGCTLWGQPGDGIYKSLNDFRYIYSETGLKNENGKDIRYPIMPADMREYNTVSVDFLTRELLKSSSKEIICVTHFMPLLNKDVPFSKYQNSEVDSYYGNELFEIMKNVNWWISGHTHQKFQLNVDEKCNWLSNAIGYPGEL